MIAPRKRMIVVAVVTTVGMFFVCLSASALGACPNEAIRGVLHSEQLPDCRAYEMVSPSQKLGWKVKFESADESRAMISSLGAFLGSNQGLSSQYLVERTSSGWVTTPLPEPLAPGLVDTTPNNPVAVSAGLGDGVFEERPASGSGFNERAYYVDGLPSGDPVEIGPVFPPSVRQSEEGEEGFDSAEPSVAGGHLLFEIEAPGINNINIDELWPGDSTVTAGRGTLGSYSLYEYDGTDGVEPKLVGVRNKGALRTDQEAQLIGQCGVSLGFPAGGEFYNVGLRVGDAYNTVAVSGGGWRVFFTVAGVNSKGVCNEEGEGTGPAVNELYARENGSETIAVSEPSREDCAACKASTPEPAVFQGASKDGSRVFFLSSQELLEGAHGMNLYEFDFDAAGEGRALSLVGSEVLGVARVAESGSRVYFVSSGRLTGQPNEYGASAVEGEPNLYMYDTEDAHIAFIGTLSASDSSDWRQEDKRPVDASWDGRFLVFDSTADLTPDDSSTVKQVFEYDAEQETLVRVSAGENEFNDDGNTEAYGAEIVEPKYVISENPRPKLTSVSEGGSVVFESSDALTGEAVLGYPNVYEYRAGQVSLISDGQDRSYVTSEQGGSEPSVRLLGEDPSGVDVFFTTADQLVPQDGDTQVDVYDARVDGGFAVASPPSCEGEGCQGALSGTPVFGIPQSTFEPAAPSTTSAPSTQAPAKTKTNGKEKKKGKGRAGRRRRRPKRGVSRVVRRRSSQRRSGR
jgi:hypothetical protein